jgi:predicted Zn-dependent protease
MAQEPHSQTILKDFDLALHELTQSSFGRRAFLAAVPVLLFACSSKPKNDLASSSASDPLTVEDEKFMTRSLLPEVRRQYPALRNADVQTYVAELGAKLSASNLLVGQPYEYTFTVVDVPATNAFALPAGTIFVTAPLLKKVESEAELAGVLGHEIAHVTARHATMRLEAQKKAKEQSWWYGAGGALVGGVASAGVASAVCPRGTEHVCNAPLIALGAGTGMQGALLIQKYAFLANSRENELEADRIGFSVALKAGFQANHIGDFYSRLQKLTHDSRFEDALKTHPPSEERVQQLQKLAAASTPNASAISSSAAFENMQKSLNS